MANLKETSFWEEGIYQWETSDPVLGGENGIDNVPTRQLANRTKWLKDNKLDKSATAANAELAKRANTADRLSAARKVGGVAFDGSVDIDLPGVNKPGNQNTSGNAATASKLFKPCKIGGVVFDGTKDIDLPGVNVKGNQHTFGNAGSAFKLYNPRKINGVPFDGTQDINATPAGAVMYFAMDAAPVGWLKANGAVVSRTLYANLFAAIGTRFGVGDGKTTFNLPDLRGEFLRCWDDGRNVDSGRSFGSWQTGTPICHDDTAGKEEFNIVGMCKEARNYGDDWIGNWPEGYWTSPYGGVNSTNWNGFFTMTRPRNVTLLACIKI
ncbi:phage tail protein [Snodgrassella communis]|uniref:phage tail protein n=1 Tax=Snodgrassella communis TaxID=2946699 RepID=UPI00286BCA99|nr:phage tail protein [Snodgrassella communis]WMY90957.1 phage tail protein [Snodgrassella communis]